MATDLNAPPIRIHEEEITVEISSEYQTLLPDGSRLVSTATICKPVRLNGIEWAYEYVITSIRNGYRYIKIMVLYLSLSENSASMTSSSLPAAPEDGCSAEASAPPAAPAWL